MSESARAESRSPLSGAAGHAARAHRGAIAYEASRLAIPLGIDPVDRVLEHRGSAVVIFGSDEDKAVGLRDRRGPSLHDLVVVWLGDFSVATVAGLRRRRASESRADRGSPSSTASPRFSDVERSHFAGFSENAALAGASHYDGNDGHAFDPVLWFRRRRDFLRVVSSSGVGITGHYNIAAFPIVVAYIFRYKPSLATIHARQRFPRPPSHVHRGSR